MDSDRPWAAPTDYVVAGRSWTYAPPPRFVYEAVVDDLERWLSPLTDETRRRVKYRLGPVFGAALREWLDHGF